MSDKEALKRDIINRVIFVEGGYVDDEIDSGGKTKYGITEELARHYGHIGEMINLPRQKAEEIYEKEFYNKLFLDHFVEISYDIAYELFDTAVNCGRAFSVRSLQRSLNVLNDRQRLYDDLKVDGIMGAFTANTLIRYLSIRKLPGEIVLYKMLNCLQGSMYVELAERREKDERFIYGWFTHRIFEKATK